MLEKLFSGPKSYYVWLLFLLCVIAGCGLVYLDQLQSGLGITGMNREVSWGLYISQFTYFVGVAASAVMLVLPAYFHHYKKFKRMIIFGEFMAVAAVVMCALFIVVDLGQPQRMLNVMLHPTPNSVMFYDMIVLIGYLCLNIVIGWVTLEAERLDVEPPKWVKPLIYLSILWAFSIHTVTAFLYAGIPGRHYWLTAIMAARFLSSAFCSGPAHPAAPALPGAQADRLRSRQGRRQDPVHHHRLRHVRERLLLSAGALHRLLQPDSGPHGAHALPLLRAWRPSGLGELLDVGGRDHGLRLSGYPDSAAVADPAPCCPWR